MPPAVADDAARRPAGALPSDTGDADAGPTLWERARAWTGRAAALTAADVPVRDTGAVPRRMWSSWKTRALGRRALALHRRWLAAEADKEFVIVTDEECAGLAALRPGFRAVYDALPLAVMRADVCRVLAVYYFGGYYRDLDVDHRRPLAEWVNATVGLSYGQEDEEHVCQWFFAARPGDQCLGHVLQHIENLVRNASAIDLRANVEAVIDHTGPGAWTDALHGCPHGPRYTAQEMRETLIKHEYAAAQWSGADYASWLEDRRQKAGSRDRWNADDHVMSRQGEHMVPDARDVPPLLLSTIGSSNAMFRKSLLFGPERAFDGSMDTAVDTGLNHVAWFSFEFAEPVTIGTVFNGADPGARHVSGLRLLNRHRFQGLKDFSLSPLYVKLFDPAGRCFYSARKANRQAGVLVWFFAGQPHAVKRIVVSKAVGGRLTFGEIQLCRDPACLSAHRVIVSPTSTRALAVPPAFRAITNISRRCPDGRAFSSRSQFQYTSCSEPPAEGCQSFFLSAHGGHVDGQFLDRLLTSGCTIQPISPLNIFFEFRSARQGKETRHLLKRTVPEDFCGQTCYTVKRFEEVVPEYRADLPIELIYVEQSRADWLRPVESSMLGLALQLKPRYLLLPVHLNSDVINAASLQSAIETITRDYDVHAFHANVDAGAFSFDGSDYPVEIHWSLTLRQP